MKKTFYIIYRLRTSAGAELKIARLEAGFAFSSGGIVLMHRPPEETE